MTEIFDNSKKVDNTLSVVDKQHILEAIANQPQAILVFNS